MHINKCYSTNHLNLNDEDSNLYFVIDGNVLSGHQRESCPEFAG